MAMLDVAIPPAWRRQWDELLEHFHDPFKLRVAVVSAIAAVGLLGIYRPMNAEVTILRRDLKNAKERLVMVRQIDQLRGARVKLIDNFPERGDINFWTEHLLSGIRDSGVSLHTLESNFRKTKVGKLQGVYFDLEIVGTYDQIHKLISGIETNKYFARIIKLRFKSDTDSIEGKLTVATLVAVKPDEHGKKAPAAQHGKAPDPGAKTTPPKPDAKAKEAPHGA